jgi:hypothetical protein
MREAFPGLHDAYDSRLRLEITISGDTLVRFLVFSRSFLELDGVDLDAVFRIGERRVERKRIGRGDLATLGVLCEGPNLCTGERLKGAVEFDGCYRRQ